MNDTCLLLADIRDPAQYHNPNPTLPRLGLSTSHEVGLWATAVPVLQFVCLDSTLFWKEPKET